MRRGSCYGAQSATPNLIWSRIAAFSRLQHAKEALEIINTLDEGLAGFSESLASDVPFAGCPDQPLGAADFLVSGASGARLEDEDIP